MKHMKSLVVGKLDPLQFAYQAHLGVDDAIIYLLHRAHSHLDRAGSAVRIMFFDFSSAFNTIQPSLLGEKLMAMQVDAPLVTWIMDYLTDRPQYVRLRDCESETLISSTGAPQGTVLSPFLFTIYTSDFRYDSETCHLQKFSDDTAIVARVTDGQEDEYRGLVNDFCDWSTRNHLRLNVGKTREMVVDFRKKKEAQLTPVTIQGADVEVVQSYKYLGVHLDNRLEWSGNMDAVYKKGQSRLYFLRRLRSFDVCRTMLNMFYQSVVASVIFFAVVCWGQGIKAADANRLDKLIKKAASVIGIGMGLDTVTIITERRILTKLRKIMANKSHPLNATLVKQKSVFSCRLTLPSCSTERFRKTFIPTAIRMFNAAKLDWLSEMDPSDIGVAGLTPVVPRAPRILRIPRKNKK